MLLSYLSWFFLVSSLCLVALWSAIALLLPLNIKPFSTNI